MPYDGALRTNSYAISKHFILAKRSAGVNFVSSLAIEESACNFVIGFTSDHGTDSSVPLPCAWNLPLCNLCFAIVINYSKNLLTVDPYQDYHYNMDYHIYLVYHHNTLHHNNHRHLLVSRMCLLENHSCQR